MSYVKKNYWGGGQIDPPPAGIGLKLLVSLYILDILEGSLDGPVREQSVQSQKLKDISLSMRLNLDLLAAPDM